MSYRCYSSLKHDNIRNLETFALYSFNSESVRHSIIDIHKQEICDMLHF